MRRFRLGYIRNLQNLDPTVPIESHCFHGDFALLQPHANAVVSIPIIGNKSFRTSIS
jgi:hypothetical protein